MTTILVISAYAYLLGSIPFGYLLVRVLHGQDVRQTGSGNIGATNVSRTSPVLGLLTLLLDALKGLAAVGVTQMIFPAREDVAALAALMAVAGHIFPVWLKFHGGKGVATGLGAFVLIAPKAVLIAIGLLIALVAAFRYVSLGSIVAFILLPIVAWALGGERNSAAVIVCMAAASALVITKHRDNIRRLVGGSENRLQLWRT